MQIVLEQLLQANMLLKRAKGWLLEQEPTFFLVMIGAHLGIVISIISVALDLLKQEMEKTCQTPKTP